MNVWWISKDEVWRLFCGLDRTGANLWELCQAAGEIAVKRSNPQLTMPGVTDFVALRPVQLIKDNFEFAFAEEFSNLPAGPD